MYYNSRKVKKQIRWKGIVVASVLTLVVLLTFFSGLSKFTNYILGIFGILFYPLMLLGILVSIACALNMKFSMSSKNVAYIVALVVCLDLLLHTAFVSDFAHSQGISFAHYFTFLKGVITFESGLTVGGVITSLITYPFMCILSPVGACILFAIALTISGALTIDYYLNLRSIEKKTRKNRNANRLANADGVTTASIGELLENNNEAFSDDTYDDDEENIFVGNDNNEKVEINNGIYTANSPDDEDNLSNDDKATSYYDPQKFSSVQEYINYPYVPQIFKHKNTDRKSTNTETNNYMGYDSSAQNNSYADYNSNYNDGINDSEDSLYSSTLNDETKDEEQNSEDIYVNENDIETPSWANETLMEDEDNAEFDDNNNPNLDEENNNEERRVRGGSAFDSSPFSPFQSALNRADRGNSRADDEVFTSPAKQFFDSAPKLRPEQISLGVSKPKTYKQEKDRKYVPPLTSLLEYRSDDESSYGGDYEQKSVALEQVLSSFNIDAKVTNVVRGPAVTQYELSMPYGTSVKKVLSYDSDIAAALMSRGGVRIEAPIPGKNAVGVEVANDKRSTVGLREMLESKEFQNSTVNLPIIVGKGISGEVVVKSLPKLVHMLVAGSTGSGKSIFLHSVILSLMFKCSPKQVRFIMIDPKRVEFTNYSGMPHMMLPNAICECDKAINALGWAVKEMERRFKKLQKYQVQNIQDFNHSKVVTETHEEEPMAYLVIVIDELADLMMVGKKEVEEKIARLAQLGRASGIHMIIATQRPSADIITGTIKNNLPTRVAFSLGSYIDSRVILDETGAEKLLGAGDMLLSAQDSNATIRLQGGFMSMDEVRKVVDYIKEHNDTYFDEELENEILTNGKEDTQANEGGNSYDPQNPDLDELLPAALKLCIETGGASINMVQRRFRVGYARAARIIDQMELAGYISPGNGSKLRTVHMTMAEFNEKFGEVN